MGGEHAPAPAAVYCAAAVFVLLVAVAATAAGGGNARVAALFVFGDSLVDAGNNNLLVGALARADYYPYGLDFPPRGDATGRFCNGKTVVDAFCDLLGLRYVPPYTPPGLNGTALLGGVNYASAAGGILDETGQHLGERFGLQGERFSLSQQVLNLETNLDAIRSLFGDDHQMSYERHLARSVAVMVLGSNDYLNNYLLTPLYDSAYKYTPDEYAGLLLDHYTRQILALYGVGLKKFLLAGIGPLGCIPNLRAASVLGGECVDQVNQMVGIFNRGLRSLVDQLNADHPDAAFVYGDTYAVTQDMISNPSEYGFIDVESGYCGLGQKRGQITCLPFVEPCDDRRQYLFWDAYHPTQAANLVLVQTAFNGTQDQVYPVNLQQLAKL